MLVIALIALCAGLSLPSFYEALQRHRAETEVQHMATALTHARMYAISHQSPVTYCASFDEKTCVTNWKAPRFAFVDGNQNGQHESDELIVQRYDAIPAQGSLHWRAFQQKPYIQFAKTGMTQHQNGHFIYCPVAQRSEFAKGLILSKLGRTRISTDSNGDSFDEDLTGQPLRCDTLG